VSVLVFPDPGGARTCNTGAAEVTAADWAAFSPSSIASIKEVYLGFHEELEESISL
jgi:hypothetical protein